MSSIIIKDNVYYDDSLEEEECNQLVTDLISYLLASKSDLTIMSSDGFRKFHDELIFDMQVSLMDMYGNPDKRFIRKYREVHCKCKCDMSLAGLDCFSMYRKAIHTRGYIGYFFNLYTILRAYKTKNYETFCSVVDDIEPIDQHLYTISLFPFEEFFLKSKTLIDYFVGLDDYNDQSFLRLVFKNILSFNYDNFEEWRNLLFQVSDDINKLTNQGYRVNYDVIKQIINFEGEGHRLYISDIKYSPILLFGDRFKYFNDNLRKIEKNTYFRNEILSRINGLSIEMFESDKHKDLFIECMSKVFNSDSYFELDSKLNSLRQASELYEKGLKNDAYCLIDNLDDTSHKGTYLGEMVSYPTKTMNKIVKPDSIVDRMKFLYKRIDGFLSYDFMDEIVECSKGSISEVMNDINEKILEKKSPFIRVKKKLKCLVDGKKI